MQNRPPVDLRSTQNQLSAEAQRLRELAEEMPVPAARERLIDEARQLEKDVKLERWLSSSELQPPR